MSNYWLDTDFSPKNYLIELLENEGCDVEETSIMGKCNALKIIYATQFTWITEGLWKNISHKAAIRKVANQITNALDINFLN